MRQKLLIYTHTSLLSQRLSRNQSLPFDAKERIAKHSTTAIVDFCKKHKILYEIDTAYTDLVAGTGMCSLDDETYIPGIVTSACVVDEKVPDEALARHEWIDDSPDGFHDEFIDLVGTADKIVFDAYRQAELMETVSQAEPLIRIAARICRTLRLTK